MAVFFFHTDILLNAFSVVKRRWQAPHPRCFLSRIGNAAAAAAAGVLLQHEQPRFASNRGVMPMLAFILRQCVASNALVGLPFP